MPLTQEGRILRLLTPLATDVLMIKRFRGSEGLSKLFRYELDIVHDHESQLDLTPMVADINQLIGQPMSVRARLADGAERHFSGICVRFTQGVRKRRYTKYHAVVVPHVWILTQRIQSRIFQNLSVPDILKKIFAEFQVTFEHQGTFEPRNYCVQYGESDFDFASRLMEEEGMFYYFVHDETTHRMVIANTPSSHQPCPNGSSFPYSVDLGDTENRRSSISGWNTLHQLRTGKYTTWDHNFELPHSQLEAEKTSIFTYGNNSSLEAYEFPGGYAKRFDGVDRGGGEQPSNVQKIFEDRRRVVEIRQQEIDVAGRTIKASTDTCNLTAGYRFELTNHPASDVNGNYVLTDLGIEIAQSPEYESDGDVENPVNVSFYCMPHGGGKPPFRPARKTAKPIIHGAQTAVVVGPSGEEIFTDKYGRVKVQFHWDRDNQVNESSSCWIRVAQTLAGNKWGAMFIPRIGMEVIVNFLDGDPDRPVITGAVYNAAAMPPYTLPDEKTKSTLKTNSSKGGNGFNELRIEDKKGSEQIFIHAEKNQDIRVKNDCMETILHDRHLIVENEQFEKVKKDKHLQVLGDHSEKIGGTMSISVGSDLQEKVSQNYALDAGMAVHIKAGMTAVIEAGTSLTLKVGGNFININPGGIFIKGTMVMLNSGGAAGSGAGCNPEAPKEPKEADKAEPGTATQMKSQPPPPAPATFGGLAALLASAAQNGTPFCSACDC
jgi:type VI secretion system secreted protein VgrG